MLSSNGCNLKSISFFLTFMLIEFCRITSSYETHSAQSFRLDSIDTEEKIRNFFFKYTNSQSLMSSTQMNVLLEDFVQMFEHDEEKSGNNLNKNEDHKCLHEKLDFYRQTSNENVYLNETTFNKLTALILADISECLAKNETKKKHTLNENTRIIINTKSGYFYEI